MKIFDRTIRYSFVQAFYWMAFAGVISFSGMYLLGCGYTNGQIGLIIAICGVVSALGQTVIASYIDRSGGKRLKPVTYVLILLLLTLSAVSLFLSASAPFVSGLLFVFEVALLQLLLPLVNSLAVGRETADNRTNFGVARGIGSLAYAAAAALFGAWAARFGIVSIPASLCVIFALMFAAALFYSYTPAAAESTVVSSGSANFLGRYPRFAILLLSAVLIYVSHCLINNYAIQIMNAKGWDSVVMGNAQAISAVSELPMMFCFTLLIKKKPVSFWLRISGIAFFLKTLLTMLSGSVAMYNSIQVIQMFGWAIISVASVQYVHELLPAEDAVKGQSYFTMAYTVATVISGLLGSALIDRFGMNVVLLIGSIGAAIGAVILLFSVEKTPQKD